MKTKSAMMFGATLVALGACGRVPIQYDYGQAELKMFSDCNELQSNVHGQLAAYRRDLAARPDYRVKAGTAVPAMAADQLGGFTNIQEQGVDEADQIKIGKHLIYTVSGTNIQVNSRTDLSEVGQLSISDMNSVKLYAQDDLLIVVGQGSTPAAGQANTSADGNTSNSQSLVEIRSYQATDDKTLPTALGARNFNGWLADSRLTAGRLILIMNDTLDYQGDVETPLPTNPVKVANGKASDITCSRIVHPPLLDQDFRLLKVASVDVLAPQNEAFEVGMMGSGDQIYMSADALYVSKNSLNWTPWTNVPADQSRMDALRENLYVTKIAFNKDTGALSPEAIGIATGRAKDQFSFQEITRNDKSYLAVATTTGYVGAGDSTAKNNLWVLGESDGKLNIVGAVSDFGAGEDIRSVRFADPMAYVVTFEKTDPLFAIDLTDPENPQMKGHLQIPGFSTYMQSIAQNRMIGIGFDAHDMGNFAWFQGIQVSLFDVSNAQSPLRIDHLLFGDRGSSSEATWDHHAFFADADRGLMAFPLIELKRPDDSDPQVYGTQLTFSGAVVLKIAQDKLVEQARLTHSEWIPADCKNLSANGQWWESAVQSQDIRRIFEVDGKLLSVSSFGVKQHALDNPSTVLKAVEFTHKPSCSVEMRFPL